MARYKLHIFTRSAGGQSRFEGVADGNSGVTIASESGRRRVRKSDVAFRYVRESELGVDGRAEPGDGGGVSAPLEAFDEDATSVAIAAVMGMAERGFGLILSEVVVNFKMQQLSREPRLRHAPSPKSQLGV